MSVEWDGETFGGGWSWEVKTKAGDFIMKSLHLPGCPEDHTGSCMDSMPWKGWQESVKDGPQDSIRSLEYTSQTRRGKDAKPLTYAPCCDDPQPRIGEQSGRIFCANCRRYLDSPIQREAPQEDDDEDG